MHSSLARGVIGNTPVFGTGIPSSSLGGPVPFNRFQPYADDFMNTDQTTRPRPAAVILAAGKGTSMGSDLPKVLHPVCGRPMVHWVVDAVRQVNSGPILMVVGHGADLVQASFEGDDSDIRFVIQEPQLGTGHAVLVCREALWRFHRRMPSCSPVMVR